MKQRIFTQLMIMLLLFILSILLFEYAPRISDLTGMGIRLLDGAAVSLAMAGIIPSAFINAILKDARRHE